MMTKKQAQNRHPERILGFKIQILSPSETNELHKSRACSGQFRCDQETTAGWKKKNDLLNRWNLWLLPSLTKSMQVWLIYGSWDGRLSWIIQLEGPKCNHMDSCKKEAERIVLQGTDGGVKTQQEMFEALAMKTAVYSHLPGSPATARGGS